MNKTKLTRIEQILRAYFQPYGSITTDEVRYVMEFVRIFVQNARSGHMRLVRGKQ